MLGAEVEEKGKKILIRANRGVILAAGGYMGSVEFVDRWIPTLGGVGVVLNTPSNDGGALMTAVRDVGAPLTHMQFFGGYPNGALDEEGKRNAESAGPGISWKTVRYTFPRPDAGLCAKPWVPARSLRFSAACPRRRTSA